MIRKKNTFRFFICAALVVSSGTASLCQAEPVFSDVAITSTATVNAVTDQVSLSNSRGLSTSTPLTYSAQGGAAMQYRWSSGAQELATASVNTVSDTITADTFHLAEGAALTYAANGASIFYTNTQTQRIRTTDVNTSDDTILMDTTGIVVKQTPLQYYSNGTAIKYLIATNTDLPSTVYVYSCGASPACPTGYNRVKLVISPQSGTALNLVGTGNNSQEFTATTNRSLQSRVYAKGVTGSGFKLALSIGGTALDLASSGNNLQTISYEADVALPEVVYPLADSNPFSLSLTPGGEPLDIRTNGNASQTFTFFPLELLYSLDGQYMGTSVTEQTGRH